VKAAEKEGELDRGEKGKHKRRGRRLNNKKQGKRESG